MRLLFAGYWSPDSQYFNFIFSLLKSLLLGRCSGGTILGSPPPLYSISPVPSGEPAPGLSTKLFETFNWILMRSGENYFDKKIDKLIAKLKVWVNFRQTTRCRIAGNFVHMSPTADRRPRAERGYQYLNLVPSFEQTFPLWWCLTLLRRKVCPLGSVNEDFNILFCDFNSKRQNVSTCLVARM